MDRIFLIVASVYGFTGVGLGAFGAHALRDQLDARGLEVWDTAVRYQLIHALFLLGIFVVGKLEAEAGHGWLKAAGYAACAGVVLFSGSLYGLVLAKLRFLGPVTPLGGLCLMLAWVFVLVHVLRS